MHGGVENARNQVSRGITSARISRVNLLPDVRPAAVSPRRRAPLHTPSRRHSALVGHPRHATWAVDENLCTPPFDSRPVPSPLHPPSPKRFRGTDSIRP